MIDRLGAYEIQREIGRGGMGVVYLARDTRLDRDVAIKALPEELATDAVRLERFRREAKTLAGLSHANLGAIYGVEEQDGTTFLVLEYVDGETLADRLDRGPMPIDEAVELGVQIAAGIEAAHEAGVVHRDLKPANIKITSDGQVKVLDFGLARADEGGVSSSGGLGGSRPDGLDSPTMTSPRHQHSPTIEGAILGTAAYMSPEQARGRRVDKRTDIWSFGVVVYEMLVGSSPFHGETATDSIGAVLHKDIDLDLLSPTTPRMLRHVLGRCLRRDRERRMQSIGDARVELADIAAALDAGQVDEAAAERRGGAMRWVWPVVAVGALAGCVALALVPRGGATAASVPAISRLEQITDREGIEYHPSLSSDGRTMLFVDSDGGDSDIYWMRVGGGNPINLTEDSTGDDFHPEFSPDGEQVAFASTREGGGIFVMGATGENPRRVSDEGFAPSWSPDGKKLVYTTEFVANPYGRSGVGELWVLDLESGERRRLATEDPRWAGDASPPLNDAVGPAWSPDGTRIAFWRVTNGQRDLFSVSADGSDHVVLTDDVYTDWGPMWSADGRGLYFLSDRGGQHGVWHIELDESGRRVGEPVAVMPSPVSVQEAAISRDETRLVVLASRWHGTVERIGFDRVAMRFVGLPETIHSTSNPIVQADVSDDGEWLTHRTDAPFEDIVVVRTDGTGMRTLTQGLAKDRGPKWSSDGSMITYYSNEGGTYNIWQMRRDGTEARVIAGGETENYAVVAWSPDDRVLAAGVMGAGRGIRLLERTDEGTLEAQDVTVAEMFAPVTWSPDGTRILGAARRPDGSSSAAIYDVAANEVLPVPLPASGDLTEDSSFGGVWLDEDRLLMWGAVADRPIVSDVSTGEAAYIDAPFTGQVNFANIIDPAASDTAPDADGVWDLYMVRNERQGDLWLVELGERSDAGLAP